MALSIVLLDAFAADQDAPNAWDALSRLGQIHRHSRIAPKDTAAAIADAEVVITNKAPLNADVIAHAPALRYIGVSATGTNIVDIAAARARGIAVTNVPGYSTESVAQLTFALILDLGLDVAGHHHDVCAGLWAASPDFCFFRKPLYELAGKTLVIVGMGAIGKTVARIGRAFGMKVVAAAVPGGTTGQDRVPLFDALAQADVVSLHCPLTPKTDRLVDDAFLRAMRPGAVLINTSRGGLIDEAALVRALETRHLGGVGLDVLAREPPEPEHALTNPAMAWSGRVRITPHIAWGTVEARARLRAEIAANLAAFLEGQRRNRVD